MKEQLVIVGAGGFGCEVLAYAQDLGIHVAGFVDSNPEALSGRSVAARILGDDTTWVPEPQHVVCIALGDPGLRLRIAAKLEAKGAKMFTLVHPTAYVAKSATLGPGSIVCPFACVAANAVLASHVVLNMYASCGHDSRVGSACVLSPYAVINGFASLGECVFMGSHAVVTPGQKVGAHSKVAAGAVVTREVPEKALAFGNPASSRQFYK